MPTLVSPDQMQVQQGDGWTLTTLAGADQANMVARRWLIAPNARTPEAVHGDCDQLLYVIRGSGTAVANGEDLPLDHESVLWLETSDRYYFAAGPEGMEILQGYTPDRP